MNDENTTEIIGKYVALKDERDALKVQIGALEKTNNDLTAAYESAKGEIGNLQGLVTKYVVSSEPDKAVDNKKKTIKDIFMDEYNKNEEE